MNEQPRPQWANTEGPSRGVGLHTSIQIGTLVAALSVVAYVLAPIRSQIEAVQVAVQAHMKEEGHAGVLAQLASFRTDLAAVRAEIAGTDRLNSVEDKAINERLDYFRGVMAGLIEKSSNIEQRLARLEALVMTMHQFSGSDAHDYTGEGLFPHGIPQKKRSCFAACHDVTVPPAQR